MGPSECFGLQGFKARWFLRVLGLPGIMMGFVVGIFAYQLCTSGKVAASTNARGNMFFVVFFCWCFAII